MRSKTEANKVDTIVWVVVNELEFACGPSTRL